MTMSCNFFRSRVKVIFQHVKRKTMSKYIWYPKNTGQSLTRAPNAVPTLVCQGPSFYLKFLVKKGHNSKNISFRVISLALQPHFVMMSKYSKFLVLIPLILFEKFCTATTTTTQFDFFFETEKLKINEGLKIWPLTFFTMLH